MGKIRKIVVSELSIGLLLLLTPVVLALPSILKERPLSDGDYISQHYILQSFLVKSIRAGQIPWWDPWTQAGTPFIANPQVAAFDPLRWLAIPWAKSTGITPAIFDLQFALSVGFLLIGTYALLRQFLGRSTGLFGAFLMGFSPVALSIYRDFPTAMSTVTWWPLLLLALIRMRRSSGPGPVVGLAGSLAGCWFAGFPPMFATVLAGGLLYVIATGSFRQQSFLRRCGLATLAGFGLSSIQLIPAIQFFLHSSKSLVASGSANPIPSFLSFFSSLFTAETFRFIPITLGTVAVTLIMSSWRVRGQDKDVRECWRFMMLSSAFVLIAWVGLPVWKHWPVLYNLVRYPHRLLVLPLTPMVVLASVGLKNWSSLISQHRRSTLWLVTAITAVAIVVTGMNASTSSLVLVFISGVIMLVTIVSGQRFSRVLTALVGIIGVVTLLFGWHQTSLVSATWSQLLAPLSVYQSVPLTGDRVLTPGSKLLENGARLFHVRQTGGWEALYLREYQGFLRAGGSAVLNGRWQLVDGQWLEQQALPRWWFPKHIEAMASREEVYADVRRDPMSLVEQSLVAPSYPWPGDQAGGQVVSWSNHGQLLNLTTVTTDQSVLVIDQINYPGWQVQVDRHRVPTGTINGGMLSAMIPAGNHQILVDYRPTVFLWGGLVSAASLIMLGVYYLRGNRGG